MVIYVLDFSFKMQSLRVSRRNNRRFFPAGSFFLLLYMITYQSDLISRKLPCPKNFLVTRLKLYYSWKVRKILWKASLVKSSFTKLLDCNPQFLLKIASFKVDDSEMHSNYNQLWEWFGYWHKMSNCSRK